MDLSLDELIKTNRGAAAKKAPPAANGKGKAPGGRKGRKPKASPRDGKAQLVSAVAKSSKAKRAQKLAKARGMDVDMAPAPGAKPRKRGAAGKLSDTLKARISAAVQRRDSKKPGAKKPGTPPAKAADIKITIAGAGAKSPVAANGRGRGRGAMAGRGRGRGRGGIVKPGLTPRGSAPAPKKGGLMGLAGAIGKKKKTRTVVVAGGKAPGGRGGKAGGRGRGGGKGGGRAGMTLAQRFMKR